VITAIRKPGDGILEQRHARVEGMESIIDHQVEIDVTYGIPHFADRALGCLIHMESPYALFLEEDVFIDIRAEDGGIRKVVSPHGKRRSGLAVDAHVAR